MRAHTMAGLDAADAAPEAAFAPDFSAVTSLEAARRLVDRGELVPVQLFPEELGGAERPRNTVYVPAGVRAALDRAKASVAQRVGKEYAVTVDVTPERRGQSFVPARIRIQAGLLASANAAAWTIDVW
jgi:hypothetical protein